MRKKGDFLVFCAPAIEQAKIDEVLACASGWAPPPAHWRGISLTAGVVEPPASSRSGKQPRRRVRSALTAVQAVLCQALVASLCETEDALDDEQGMLDLGAHAGLGLVLRPLEFVDPFL